MKTLRNILIFLTISGCTKMCEPRHEDLSPDQVTEQYLNIVFNMQSPDEKLKLLQITSGPMKESIEKASDATIMEAYVERKYELLSYSVIERKDRTPRETEVVFTVSYREKDESAPTVVTENRISLLKHRGAWFLHDVIGKKSSFDFATSPSEIRATPE
jgi:hypothetical protein